VPGRAEPDRSRDRGWDRMAVKTGYRGFKLMMIQSYSQAGCDY
jgi:hypothetical protein